MIISLKTGVVKPERSSQDMLLSEECSIFRTEVPRTGLLQNVGT